MVRHFIARLRVAVYGHKRPVTVEYLLRARTKANATKAAKREARRYDYEEDGRLHRGQVLSVREVGSRRRPRPRR